MAKIYTGALKVELTDEEREVLEAVALFKGYRNNVADYLEGCFHKKVAHLYSRQKDESTQERLDRAIELTSALSIEVGNVGAWKLNEVCKEEQVTAEELFNAMLKEMIAKSRNAVNILNAM